MPNDELTILRIASEGLLYPSESDEPFDVFRWTAEGPEPQAHQVLAQTGKKPDETVEEISLSEFFEGLSEHEDAERFKQLRRVIDGQLCNTKVFRIGLIQIDVYLVGKTRAGDWAGLHTKSIET
jgi:Nuclease A inhibitor-like protein